MQPSLFFGLVVLSLFPFTFAVRIVVDDANPSWTYSSPWNAVSPSNPCTSCLIQPDPAKTLNQTWHDTAYINTAQLSFTGVSIEIYTICPPTLSSGDSYGTNFSFTLDSIADGTFVGPQPACPQYTYNYLVYARSNLSVAQHVVVIANNQIGSLPNTSNLLLDYAIYDDGSTALAPTHVSGQPSSASTSTNTPSANNKSQTLPLVAAIVPGAVAVVLLVVVMVQFFTYRSRPKPPIREGGLYEGSQPRSSAQLLAPISSGPAPPAPQTTMYNTGPNSLYGGGSVYNNQPVSSFPATMPNTANHFAVSNSVISSSRDGSVYIPPPSHGTTPPNFTPAPYSPTPTPAQLSQQDIERMMANAGLSTMRAGTAP